MVTSGASVGERVIGTIELVDTVDDVVGSVRVHQIDNNLNTHRMSLVDEELEIIWCSLSRGDTEKSCYVISKTTIVGMFLDSHELNVSISCLFNSWKDMFGVLNI